MSLQPLTLHKSILTGQTRPEVAGIVSQMTVGELQELQLTISNLLGEKADVRKLDLQQMTVVKINQMEALLQDVLTDDTVPPNQKATVASMCHSLIKDLTKTRIDLYNSARVYQLEQILKSVMKDQPIEVKDAFLAAYREALQETEDGLEA